MRAKTAAKEKKKGNENRKQTPKKVKGHSGGRTGKVESSVGVVSLTML